MAKATRLHKAGDTPRYYYKGVTVTNSAGSSWGRGFIFTLSGVTRYSTTLSGAKFTIDYWVQELNDTAREKAGLN